MSGNALLDRYLDERATAWQTAQNIRADVERDTGKDLTTEQDAAYTRALDDVERLSALIEREERAARLAAVDFGQVRSSGGDEHGAGDGDTESQRAYSEAFGIWTRHGNEELSSEQRKLLRSGFVSAKDLNVRAQGTGTGAAGGFTVPQEFMDRLTETMKAYGGLLRYATVITTSHGGKIPWAANDDTANEGALLTENTQVTEQDFVFEGRELDAYTYTSKLVRVALQLIQDSAFDMDAWLPKRLGVRIARALAGHLATGTGTNQPQGVTNFAVGRQGGAGQTTSITFDDLIDLVYSVDAAYRDAGNCRFAGNDLIIKAARKLKDGNGQYLWQPSTQAGQPDLLLGYPVAVDNKMPAPAASAKPLAFGDIGAGLIVRRVQGATVLRLTERFADFLQVGFLGFERFDSAIDDAGAVRLYQHAAA